MDPQRTTTARMPAIECDICPSPRHALWNTSMSQDHLTSTMSVPTTTRGGSSSNRVASTIPGSRGQRVTRTPQTRLLQATITAPSHIPTRTKPTTHHQQRATGVEVSMKAPRESRGSSPRPGICRWWGGTAMWPRVRRSRSRRISISRVSSRRPRLPRLQMPPISSTPAQSTHEIAKNPPPPPPPTSIPPPPHVLSSPSCLFVCASTPITYSPNHEHNSFSQTYADRQVF